MRNNILLIEDNELNRELVTDILEMAGYVVHTAETAEEGLKMARAQQPDLVLMDIRLPGMDGIEAVREMRQDEVLKDVKTVALTAQAMIGDEKTAVEAGFDGYVTKPISTRQFVDDVMRYLPLEEQHP